MVVKSGRPKRRETGVIWLLFLFTCVPIALVRVEVDMIYKYRVSPLTDGPSIVITVWNDTNNSITAFVECSGDLTLWIVDVPANDHVSAIGELMNKDIIASPCRVVDTLIK
jgi:hypothetical protein